MSANWEIAHLDQQGKRDMILCGRQDIVHGPRNMSREEAGSLMRNQHTVYHPVNELKNLNERGQTGHYVPSNISPGFLAKMYDNARAQ